MKYERVTLLHSFAFGGKIDSSYWFNSHVCRGRIWWGCLGAGNSDGIWNMDLCVGIFVATDSQCGGRVNQGQTAPTVKKFNREKVAAQHVSIGNCILQPPFPNILAEGGSFLCWVMQVNSIVLLHHGRLSWEGTSGGLGQFTFTVCWSARGWGRKRESKPLVKQDWKRDHLESETEERRQLEGISAEGYDECNSKN